MYRIIDHRGSGKTSRLMLLAKEHNGTVVCSNPYAMEQKAHSYGITGVDFVSYYDFLNNCKDVNLGNYYIDELEIFMQFIASQYAKNGNFNGYTLTEED